MSPPLPGPAQEQQRDLANRLGYEVPSAAPPGVPPPQRTRVADAVEPQDRTRVAFDPQSDPNYGYDGHREDAGYQAEGRGVTFDQGYNDQGYDDQQFDQAYDGQEYDQGYGDDGYGDDYGSSGVAFTDDYDDDPPYSHAPDEQTEGRRSKRQARQRSRAIEREARWERHRLAVPYRTDGPKLTFGVVWFALIMGAVFFSPLAVALLTSCVAAIAALQVGYAWYPRHMATRWWVLVGAFLASMAGVIGSIGVPIAVIIGIAVAVAYAVANPSRSQSTVALTEVAARAIVPVAVAAASLAALANIGTGAILALVLLVSAYEMGDFIVGSGSSNAVEGPISGLLSMSAVVFILWVVTPSPFSSSSMVLFGALTGILCVLGQIFASALLPRGGMWAPALRRLDSYLLTAPLWVVLVGSLPTATTL